MCKWIEDRRIEARRRGRRRRGRGRRRKRRRLRRLERREAEAETEAEAEAERRTVCAVGREWERKKRREARDLFARISTGGRSPWPLPRNAFRIRPLPRNMFCDGVEVSASIQAKPVTEVCYCFRGPRFLRYAVSALSYPLRWRSF